MLGNAVQERIDGLLHHGQDERDQDNRQDGIGIAELGAHPSLDEVSRVHHGGPAQKYRDVEADLGDEQEFATDGFVVAAPFVLAEHGADHAHHLGDQVCQALEKPHGHRVMRHGSQAHESRDDKMVQFEPEDVRYPADERIDAVAE